MQFKVSLRYCLKSQFMIMFMFDFMNVTIKVFFVYLYRLFIDRKQMLRSLQHCYLSVFPVLPAGSIPHVMNP